MFCTFFFSGGDDDFDLDIYVDPAVEWVWV